MQSSFFDLALPPISSGIFVNEIVKERSIKENEEKEAFNYSKLALIFNSPYLFSKSFINCFLVYDNCQAARNALLYINPGAKKALDFQ